MKANKLEGRHMEPHMHSGIMATHWQQWNCMTLERRSEYQYKPIAAQEDVRQSVRVLEENFMLERSSVPQKLEDQQDTRLSIMRLTSARLSATEKDRLNDLFHGATFSRSRVTNLRKAAQANVLPPDIEYTLLLDSLETGRSPPSRSGCVSSLLTGPSFQLCRREFRIGVCEICVCATA